MRWITSGAVAGVLAMTLVACSSGTSSQPAASSDTGSNDGGQSSQTRSLTIGWVAPDSTGVFKTATDYFEAAAAEAKDAGFDIKIAHQSPPGGQTDNAGMVQIIETMVSQKVDALMVSPADTEAIKPAIKRANEAGIPVVYINLLADQDGIQVDSYIGYDNFQAAQVAAYSVLDYFGGPGVQGAGEKADVAADQYLDLAFWEELYADVDPASITATGVIIEGLKGSFYSNERVNGFMDVMDKFPNVEVVEVQPGDWNREAGATAAEDFLAKYNDIDFIWAASNEMGLGAVNVAERVGRLDDAGKAGPTEGKVAVFTNDSTPESTDVIRAGKLTAEVTHGFPDWGWLGTEVGVRLACGLEVDTKVDIRPRVVWQDNADLFYPNPSLPEIDWAGIAADCKL